MKNTPVNCGGCGREYPRDPALEVECSSCGAKVGHRCVVRRPSGHVHSAGFGGLGDGEVHDVRDLTALVAGHYVCSCGISIAEGQRRLDCVLRGESWKLDAQETLLLGLGL